MDTIDLSIIADVSGYELDSHVIIEALSQGIYYRNQVCNIRSIKYKNLWKELQIVTTTDECRIIDAIRYNTNKITVVPRGFLVQADIQSSEELLEYEVDCSNVFFGICKILWDMIPDSTEDSSYKILEIISSNCKEKLVSQYEMGICSLPDLLNHYLNIIKEFISG